MGRAERCRSARVQAVPEVRTPGPRRNVPVSFMRSRSWPGRDSATGLCTGGLPHNDAGSPAFAASNQSPVSFGPEGSANYFDFGLSAARWIAVANCASSSPKEPRRWTPEISLSKSRDRLRLRFSWRLITASPPARPAAAAPPATSGTLARDMDSERALPAARVPAAAAFPANAALAAAPTGAAPRFFPRWAPFLAPVEVSRADDLGRFDDFAGVRREDFR